MSEQKFGFASHEDQFVCGCERDTDNPFNNSGPMTMEQHLGNADLLMVIERAESFRDRYGKTMIFRLVPVGTPEECRMMLKNK